MNFYRNQAKVCAHHHFYIQTWKTPDLTREHLLKGDGSSWVGAVASKSQ